MATTEIPSQRMRALAYGNGLRLAAAALKRELKAGNLTVAEALDDERAAIIPIIDVLRSQPGWGKVPARRILSRHQIGEGRRVSELTARQRRVIAAECSA